MEKIPTNISSIFTDSTASLSDGQENVSESSSHGISMVSSSKKGNEAVVSAEQKFSKEKAAVTPLDQPSIFMEGNTFNELRNKLALKIDGLKELSKQAANPDRIIYQQAIQSYGKAVIALNKVLNTQEPEMFKGLPPEHNARVQHRIFSQQLITRERAIAKYAQAAGDVILKKMTEPNQGKQEMLQDIVNSYDMASYHKILAISKMKSGNFNGAVLHDQIASLHASLAEVQREVLTGAKTPNDPSFEKLNKKITAYKKQIDLSENLQDLKSEVAQGSRGKNDLTIDALQDEIEEVQRKIAELEK